MNSSGTDFDPQLWQARWVLGGVEPDEFVKMAISALENGLYGTALQQIAGLSAPTARDMGKLPEKLFAEMGLRSIERDEAVTRLIARGKPSTSPTITTLRQAFPEFSERWKKHIEWWHGNSAGSYNDMAEFVHFVIKDVFEKGNLEDTRCIFQLLETPLVEADQDVRDLIGLGFFETLQNVASWRPGGNKVYEQFFGPVSKQLWSELQAMWAGKSSVMDVIRAQRRPSNGGQIPINAALLGSVTNAMQS
jgi:hypothetical protein